MLQIAAAPAQAIALDIPVCTNPAYEPLERSCLKWDAGTGTRLDQYACNLLFT